MRKVFIGSDHAGFKLKQELLLYVEELGFDVEDKGAYVHDEVDDYPDYCVPVAQATTEYDGSVGIVIGGSGQGEAIVANKFPGVRAVVYNGNSSPERDEIRFAREHNNANVLSLGARFISDIQAKEAVRRFLEIEFSNEARHVRRLAKIKDVETMLYDKRG